MISHSELLGRHNEVTARINASEARVRSLPDETRRAQRILLREDSVRPDEPLPAAVRAEMDGRQSGLEILRRGRANLELQLYPFEDALLVREFELVAQAMRDRRETATGIVSEAQVVHWLPGAEITPSEPSIIEQAVAV